MLLNKQFYYYVVEKWLNGDPAGLPPPVSHTKGRNSDWIHLFNDDVLSMPDKWEYPWFASWDLAFHLIPLATLDPDFAKLQFSRLTREWYMHPNGQIPAYEWAFGDVNPPVQAWAAWNVYKIERELYNRTDKDLLERVFQKLLLNFTWWVNRKDVEGRNIFQGGFLGLDNIGIFDRSAELPTGGNLQQADGTSWMGMYCLNMLEIALELAKSNPTYEDIASKFFEHFLYIADAIDGIEQSDISLWDERDGFYYDALRFPEGHYNLMKVRSPDSCKRFIIESIQRFYSYFGDDFKIECPSGREITLKEVAVELSERLIKLFEQARFGQKPCYGGTEKFQHDPHWRELILFHEYFHGDNGAGLGASHQTGWTGIVARLIQQCAKSPN